jgi:hypothetical protein
MRQCFIRQNVISFASSSCFPIRWLLVGLLEGSGGLISFPLSIIFHHGSSCSPITWGMMNNRPVFVPGQSDIHNFSTSVQNIPKVTVYWISYHRTYYDHKQITFLSDDIQFHVIDRKKEAPSMYACDKHKRNENIARNSLELLSLMFTEYRSDTLNFKV